VWQKKPPRFFSLFQPKPKKQQHKFASMPNIQFSFLYRDAANYKTFAAIVFANPENIPLEDIKKTILTSCNVNQNFDPLPWSLPNIRTQPYDPELDHDWYEFSDVLETDHEPNDVRTLSEFLEIVKANVLEY
jgi:hypothetical protein